MSCVPPVPNNHSGPKEYLNQLLTLIATLRGGESRFLPLVMAKVRDTLPAIADQLPPTWVGRAAVGTPVTGSAFGPLGGINGSSGANGLNGVSGVVMGRLHAVAGQHEGYIKQEPTSASSEGVSSSVSERGSPYSAPAFMHFYPLA